MLLDEKEVTERMESPLNLLNRLRSITTNKHSRDNTILSLPPKAEQVIDDLEDKLKYGSLKSKAASIMSDAMDELKARIPEVTKPDQLARIAENMNRIVSAENKNNDRDKMNAPQFVMYAPQFVSENHYETIYAKE